MNLDYLKELKIKGMCKPISASLREDKEPIEDVYEPYLLQEGFIEKTSRGRQATRKAYQHLNINVPQGLF
jgi:holliday junction DNA helicase RuvB